MSDGALAGVELHACAIAVASWKEALPVLPDFDRTGRGPTVVDPSSGAPVTMMRVAGSRTLAERVAQVRVEPPVRSLSDSAGVAQFEWATELGSPLAEAVRQVRGIRPRGGQAPSVFVAFIVGMAVESYVQFVVADGTGSPELDDFVDGGVIRLDLAWTAVGHVTKTEAKLWFRSNVGDIHWGESLAVEIRPAANRATPVVRSVPVADFDHTWAYTRTVVVGGLDPGTAYRYHLIRHHRDGTRTVMCGGSFRTAPAQTDTVRIAFGSCHEGNGLGRWDALFGHKPDLVLLMGDQIYGDSVEVGPAETWADAYHRRYLSTWGSKRVRRVLAQQSVLMMLDDHEVTDDWGTTFTSSSGGARVDGAMKAFHAFAGDRNPGPAVRSNYATTAVDYAFEWGFVHGYALDCRTQRGIDSRFPVLGEDQMARFEQWSLSLPSNNDVVVVVIPVPIAYLDGQVAKSLIASAGIVGGVGGALVGGGLTAALGGPAGWVAAAAIVGAAIGSVLADEAVQDRVEIDRQGRVVEPDLADLWDAKENKADLERILKTLFRIANSDGGRVVIVVSGDTHMGSLHRITSSDPAHRFSPAVYQAVSSPIAHEPSGRSDLFLTGSAVIPGIDLFNYGLGDGFRAELLKPVPESGWIPVPPLVDERNVGTLTVSCLDPVRRHYELRLAIRGETMTRALDLRYDLAVSGSPTSVYSSPEVR